LENLKQIYPSQPIVSQNQSHFIDSETSPFEARYCHQVVVKLCMQI